MGISKGEIEKVEYQNSKGEPRFLITCNQNKTLYYIYECSGSELKKLGRAKTPTELEKKYIY